jgi:hypothetical protein
MTTTPWHAGPELLARYADGSLDDVGQAAVEAHVEQCPDCRADATTLVTRPALEPVWGRVLVGVRTPHPGRVTTLLRWLRVPEVDVVVLRSSANVLVAMAVAVTVTFGFALVAAQLSQDRQELAWLTIAPLLPALLVAGAFDSTDPIRELTDPTPYSKLRVALLRTLVAVLGALPLVVVMALVPEIDVSVAAWLLPALAIAGVLLVLLTRLSAAVAVVAVAVTWVLGVAALRAGDQVDQVTAPLGQSLSLLVAIASALVLARRWGLLRPERARS